MGSLPAETSKQGSCAAGTMVCDVLTRQAMHRVMWRTGLWNVLKCNILHIIKIQQHGKTTWKTLTYLYLPELTLTTWNLDCLTFFPFHFSVLTSAQLHVLHLDVTVVQQEVDGREWRLNDATITLDAETVLDVCLALPRHRLVKMQTDSNIEW